MKTNTIKLFLTSAFAYLIACSVLMAHMHVGDIVKLSGTDKVKLAPVIARTDDIHAKVIGEMHTHIDKVALKNVTADAAPARRRLVEPQEAIQDESLLEQMASKLLLLRIMLTMPVSTLA